MHNFEKYAFVPGADTQTDINRKRKMMRDERARIMNLIKFAEAPIRASIILAETGITLTEEQERDISAFYNARLPR